MQKSNLLKKGLVLGIIVLLTALSIGPVTSSGSIEVKTVKTKGTEPRMGPSLIIPVTTDKTNYGIGEP